jgi:hypothetical protein
LLLQEEVEMRANVLRVHRLAVATRSRSVPLPGFDLSSSSAGSSKPGSRESSADQAAALAHALTMPDAGVAAAAEHGAEAALERVAAAAAAAADRMMGQQQSQPGSSSDYYRRARSWGHDFSSGKGGGGGTGHHVTFMHAQHSVANPAAAASAIAALDSRPSALYTAAADALGAFGKPAGAAAAAAAVVADNAGHISGSKPQVSLDAPVEGSNRLQEQLWLHGGDAGQASNTAAAAASAGSVPAAAAVLRGPAGTLQPMQHPYTISEQPQQQRQGYNHTAVVGGAATPDNSTYASAKSLAEAAAAAAPCSTLISSSCGSMQLQQATTRRTFTNLAAPLTPMLRDVLSSCTTPAPVSGMQDAAAGSRDQQTLLVSYSSNNSDESSKISIVARNVSFETKRFVSKRV